MMLLIFIVTMLLMLVSIHPSSSTPNSSQKFRVDPYAILRVDPQCTQQEIQRGYRALCLKHHPDKQRAAEGEGEGGVDADFAFKEVQHAYSLIGTEEDRRNHELRGKFQFPPHANNHHAFAGRAANPSTNNNRFGERSEMYGPSTIYFTFGDGQSFRFANPFVGGNLRRKNEMFSGTSQNSRPHYIQKIPIPLSVLYSGGENVELKLKASIFERYRAAYHGGILKPAVMQGAVTVLLNWIRSQRVNWVLSIFMFAALVHVNLPPPPDRVQYRTNIRRGWKGGTKIKYSSAAANATFILQEEKHETFTRVGHDLHAQVEVSPQQLRRGCTLTIAPLCDSEEPITIKLKRCRNTGKF